MNHPSPVLVLGRFPPPLDGQAVATRRLADLLTRHHTVQRVDLSAPETHTAAEVRLRLDRIRHYLYSRSRIRAALSAAPTASVLWTAISPAPLGHARDLLTVVPAFQPHQAVWAVVHRGDFHRAFEHPLTGRTMQALVRRLRGIVFLNQTLAERCAPWLPRDRRFVVPNTIEDTVLCSRVEIESKRQHHHLREPLRLLFLSNMILSKGYLDVLHAVRHLHQRGVPIHADFAGRWVSEDDRQAFERLVRDAELRDVVTHHGGVRDRARIRALYLHADVFMLPTYYPTEAQPLTILEAMNAGTPIVSTRHAGIPDMVRDGKEALLVPHRSPEALADAVVQMQNDSLWLHLSRGARARFEAAFSPDAVQRQWDTLLSG